MHLEEEMNFTERRKYPAVMRRRYQDTRRERSALLDEMEAVTGLHRKSLIRLLSKPSDSSRCWQRRPST